MAPSIPSPWLPLSVFLLISTLSLSSAQSNLQTFFPSLSSPAFTNQPPPPPSPFSTANTTPPPSSNSNSNRNHIIEAVVATAATCFALSGLLFFIFYRYTRHKGGGPATPRPAAGRVNPDLALKGVIVDENGLDVLYWRNLAYSGSGEGPTKVCSHCSRPLPLGAKQKYDINTSNEYSESHERSDSGIHERPLLPLNSINSSATLPESRVSYQSTNTSISSLTAKSTPAPLAPPALPPPPPPPPPSKKPTPSPPPPPPPAKKPTPSPPPPPLPKKPSAPPPPKPPLPGSKNPGGLSTPPPMPGGGAAKPPLAPVSSEAVESARDPTKMKPLHWDKMNLPKDEHSMVWDKITNGSFRVDDDLMEALFGYVATNRKSPTSSSTSTNPFVDPPRSPTQMTILEPRKSQNIAIVVRTLAVSRNDILDALLDGRGLSPDTLEKLSRIAPSKDEQSQILSFSGDPSRLSDGDSFLFHLLRAVPQPFGRIDAMLFRSTFEHEIRHVSESLHTLELACGELRTRGLFLKLLEAILKAGNRMNAGTARGNAQAFNLTTLCKLSDVKSTDGKTTLLHFVVEEVVRSEGKRCMISRNQSLRRSISRSDSITSNGRGRSGARSGVDAAKREEREKEYMMLGLPVVGGLSTEFGNVKRAAAVDYDTLVGACGNLGARVAEIRGFLVNCPSSSEGHDKFVKEMGGFLDAASEQVLKMSREQDRVLELVVKTREYYQTKDGGAQPLQLFVIVRDFLVMVDKACVDLTRNLQKKKLPPPPTLQAVAESPTGSERGRILPARFPNLPPHFMSDGTRSPSDSDSEDGF